MWGQPGQIQISSSETNGADIVTPAENAGFATLYLRASGNARQLWAKDPDGSVYQVLSGATAVIYTVVP